MASTSQAEREYENRELLNEAIPKKCQLYPRIFVKFYTNIQLHFKQFLRNSFKEGNYYNTDKEKRKSLEKFFKTIKCTPVELDFNEIFDFIGDLKTYSQRSIRFTSFPVAILYYLKYYADSDPVKFSELGKKVSLGRVVFSKIPFFKNPAKQSSTDKQVRKIIASEKIAFADEFVNVCFSRKLEKGSREESIFLEQLSNLVEIFVADDSEKHKLIKKDIICKVTGASEFLVKHEKRDIVKPLFTNLLSNIDELYHLQDPIKFESMITACSITMNAIMEAMFDSYVVTSMPKVHQKNLETTQKKNDRDDHRSSKKKTNTNTGARKRIYSVSSSEDFHNTSTLTSQEDDVRPSVSERKRIYAGGCRKQDAEGCSKAAAYAAQEPRASKREKSYSSSTLEGSLPPPQKKDLHSSVLSRKKFDSGTEKKQRDKSSDSDSDQGILPTKKLNLKKKVLILDQMERNITDNQSDNVDQSNDPDLCSTYHSVVNTDIENQRIESHFKQIAAASRDYKAFVAGINKSQKEPPASEVEESAGALEEETDETAPTASQDMTEMEHSGTLDETPLTAKERPAPEAQREEVKQPVTAAEWRSFLSEGMIICIRCKDNPNFAYPARFVGTRKYNKKYRYRVKFEFGARPRSMNEIIELNDTRQFMLFNETDMTLKSGDASLDAAIDLARSYLSKPQK